VPVLHRSAFTLLLAAAFCHFACAQSGHATLTTVAQVRQLDPARSGEAPVVITGVVTFYEPAEHVLFVQDKTGPIFIHTTHIFPIHTGSLVEVRGSAAASFQAVIASDEVRVLGTAPLPAPRIALFPDLIYGRWDCSYVTVTGTVRAATVQQTVGRPFLLLEVLMDGGYISAHVENAENFNFASLLGARVSLTGVSGGSFDGKFQLVGEILYLDSPRDLHLLESASVPPGKLPLTPMDRVMTKFNVEERSQQVRVRGSVTLYEPGSRLVLEEPHTGKAILVHTHESGPLNLGQVVDAVGFPDASDYSQSLDHGQFILTPYNQPIQPRMVAWRDALSGQYAFNLISIEGKLVAQVHELQQDTLVIDAGGHMFSAELPHAAWPGAVISPGLPAYPANSRVRVSGVCFVEAGGPWNNPLWFEMHLRNAQDVTVLALPSWWTVGHLVYVSAALGMIIIGSLAWAATLRLRVLQQTRVMKRTMREEAGRERRRAYLEKERGRVLEAINSSLGLDEVLRMITDFISEQRHGLPCWCVRAGGDVIGCAAVGYTEAPPVGLSGDITSSTGERLGAIIAAREEGEDREGDREIIDMGASLAALAIDNRRLYDGLLHRSEYDQLTEVPNRFLLKERFKEAVKAARRNRHQLALVYIDLDRFKSVNDRYGHQVGDMYLQQVALRLQGRLRDHDTLARMGGDEFVALISRVHNREEAEGIARRLNHCFDLPFLIDGLSVDGAASLGIAVYPDDGQDEDELSRAADDAMYAVKQAIGTLQ
jgi:diguanylate cyclase (GGDEF)-like protein